MANHFERGRLLYKQRNYKLAEKEFREALGQEPGDSASHAMLALTLSVSGKPDEALKHAKEAVGLAPDSDYNHYALAIVFYNRSKLGEARTAVKEAIDIDPFRPEYFTLLGEIELVEGHFSDALKAAEEALAQDAEDVEAINVRAKALVRLGRTEEAETAVQAALDKDPENSLTHANRGWVLLHKGSTVEALESYREALRLNPNSEYAREGVVAALKARNPLYHLLLRASFGMSRLGTKARIIILLLIFITPIRGLVLLIVLMCWASNLLFNLILSFDPLGKIVLSRAQLNSARSFAIWCLLAVPAVGYLVLSGKPQKTVIMAVIYSIFTALPLVRCWTVVPGKQRIAAFIYAGLVAIVGGAGLVVSMLSAREGAGSGLLGLTILMGLIFPFKREDD